MYPVLTRMPGESYRRQLKSLLLRLSVCDVFRTLIKSLVFFINFSLNCIIKQKLSQRPVRVGLHCQARSDYPPWRQCSLYGINLQLDNRGGNSRPCPPLHCLKKWQSDHTRHHPHRFNELATKMKSGMGSPDWNASMTDINLRKLLWTSLNMPEWWEMTEQIDWRAKQPSQLWLACGNCGLLLRRSEVLRSLRHYLRVQSQGHHTIDRLEERGVERGSYRQSCSKGWERAIVNQTNNGTVSKATLGKLLRDGWSAYRLFRAHKYHLELNSLCLFVYLCTRARTRLCVWVCLTFCGSEHTNVYRELSI